jgi:hypothetical protein
MTKHCINEPLLMTIVVTLALTGVVLGVQRVVGLLAG